MVAPRAVPEQRAGPRHMRHNCSPSLSREPPNGHHQPLFTALLYEDDARRATAIVRAILAHGLHCALTGGPAFAAQRRACGRPLERRALNDVDLVVHSFADIPPSLAASLLLNHVHPDAAAGRTLLQLIDEPHRLRTDLFCAFSRTLAPSASIDEVTGTLPSVSVEDLVARTTAMVCGQLRLGRMLFPVSCFLITDRGPGAARR